MTYEELKTIVANNTEASWQEDRILEAIGLYLDTVAKQLEEYKTKMYVTGITHDAYEFGACHAMDTAIKMIKRGDIL